MQEQAGAAQKGKVTHGVGIARAWVVFPVLRVGRIIRLARSAVDSVSERGG